MKRKLLCVFLMLVGAASLAGTILLSRGIYIYPDASAYTLIVLSVVTTAVAAWLFGNELKKLQWVFRSVSVLAVLAGSGFIVMFFSIYTIFIYTLVFIIISAIAAAVWNSDKEPYRQISEREKVFLRAIRAVSVLAVLADVAFVVIMFFLTRYYAYSIHGVFFLIVLAAAGIAAAVLGLKDRPPVIRRDIVTAAAALIIAASLVFVYSNYMPKYS